MAPVRRSSSRLHAAPPTLKSSASHRPVKRAKTTTTASPESSLSPIDSGYASDSSSHHARATSADPCSSSACSPGRASPRSTTPLSTAPPLPTQPRAVQVTPVLSLKDLVPDLKPPSVGFAPLAPPSATNPPSQLPPLSPLLALFPSPVQCRLAIASYFSAPPAWTTAADFAAEHERFLAELNAPSSSQSVDFGWLALLFAVVGVGAVTLESKGLDGGVLAKGMGELWIKGAVALLELAEWRVKPTMPVLRTVLALNGYWAGFEDGRYLEQAVRLNEAVRGAFTEEDYLLASPARNESNASPLAALEASTHMMRLMLGAPVQLSSPAPSASAATSPAEISARLHIALADEDRAGARTHAGRLLDAWDAVPSATPLAVPTVLAFLSGALVLARDAVANPYSPASFGTRARLLARLARPPLAAEGQSLLLERGLELLSLALAGEEGKWPAKCEGWVQEADARREAEEARAREAELVAVKEEEEGWGRFLIE